MVLWIAKLVINFFLIQLQGESVVIDGCFTYWSMDKFMLNHLECLLKYTGLLRNTNLRRFIFIKSVIGFMDVNMFS